MPTERKFVWTAWLIHLVLLSAVALYHEPWHDEIRPWRLAIDSVGLDALFRNTLYEGHPLLWHVLLQVLGHLSRSWWAVAAFNTALASATAWVILQHAPLSRAGRVAVVLSYYPFYAYGVVVRSYGLGVFLAFAACAAWTAGRRRPWLAGILLILLANTSVLGTIIAANATLAFAVDWAWPDDRQVPPSWGRRLAIGALIAAVSALVLAGIGIQLHQPVQTVVKLSINSPTQGAASRLGHLLAIPVSVFLPNAIANETGTAWQIGLVNPTSRAGLVAADLASLVVIGLCLATVSRRRVAVVLWLTGLGTTLAFLYLFFEGYQRHHGHLVIIWLMSCWLAGSRRQTAPSGSHVRTLSARATTMMCALLAPSLIASFQYGVGDIRLPFSDATHVAALLASPAYDGVDIVADPPGEAMSVAAHLNRPVFTAAEGRVTKFATWWYVDPALADAPAEQMHTMAVERAVLSRLRTACAVVVLTVPTASLPPSVAPHARLAYESQGAVIFGERYRIWRVNSPFVAGCPDR